MSGVHFATGDTLPEMWDQAVRTVGRFGQKIKTQYDQEGDPPSRDCMMVMQCNSPLAEPRIHGFMPGGPADLEEYCMEVIEGLKDHWVGEPPLWSYTYHERVAEQISEAIKLLQECGYTRRAQAVTWRPLFDNKNDDPPCLQRIWFRIIDRKLHMHTYWRSRDALKAAFMNAFAMVRWGELLCEWLGVEFGRYVDTSDSFHIYGKDMKDFRDRFLRTDRRYDYRGDWEEMMDEARLAIVQKVEKRDRAS